MKQHLLVFSILFSALLFSGCTKDVEQKDTTPQATITYKLSIKNEGVTNGRLQKHNSYKMMEGSFSLSEGYVTTSGVSFEGTYNGGQVLFKFTKTFTVDFTSAAGMLGSITLPVGTYENATLGIGFVPSGDKAALEMRGSYSNGALTIPIVFRVDSPFDVKVSKATPTVITENPDFIALASMQIAKLAEGLTEEALVAAELTNGVLVISATSNTNLYNTIYNNLQEVINIELQ